MARTVRELKDRLKLIDLVLEVRDARIPFSSANPELENLVRHKRRLIVLNKADLAAPDKQQAVLHRFQEQQLSALFTSSQKQGSIQQLLQTIMRRLKADKPNADMLMIMAVGIPNSGKSTLINALRHAAKLGKGSSSGGKAATGATPGLTRHISGFQVGERPTAFLMDTPGVMLPNVPNEEVGMRLALTGAIKDSIVGEERLVQHLLLELAHQPSFTGEKPGLISKHAEKVPLLQRATTAAVDTIRHSLQDSQPAKDWADELTSLQQLNHDVDMDDGLAALQHTLQQKTLDMDKSRLDASYRKLLQAYRAGGLGRYTLDSL
ncbi:hypothetical protein ABBQ38_009833 [Trebouxia sp. C0009 RCD-2024]